MTDFDFGFSVVSEEELTEPVIAKTATTQKRLDNMYESILPLLKNLKGDPTNDYIKWPGADRHTKINQFMDMLHDIYEGEIE